MPTIYNFNGVIPLGFELLWENPNPNAAYTTSGEITCDYKKYKYIFVLLKYYYTDTIANLFQLETIDEIISQENSSPYTISRVLWAGKKSNEAIVGYRSYWYTTSGIFIHGTVAGWTSSNGGTQHAQSGDYCIPVAIYGSNVQLDNTIYTPIAGNFPLPSEVINGKTYYDNAGTAYTGTMPNKGAVTAQIGRFYNSSLGRHALENYRIPAGYHNGSGIISVNGVLYNPYLFYKNSSANSTSGALSLIPGISYTAFLFYCETGYTGGYVRLQLYNSTSATWETQATVTAASQGVMVRSAVSFTGSSTYPFARILYRPSSTSSARSCVVICPYTSNAPPSGITYDSVQTEVVGSEVSAGRWWLD